MNNEYENFDLETKQYLNKIMEIYLNYLNMGEIVLDLDNSDEHKLLADEKLGVSIYLAAFFTEGNLNNVLSKYDDIRLEDLLYFFHINRDVPEEKHDENFYKMFYDTFIKYYIENDMTKKIDYNINKITPEVIFLSVRKLFVLHLFYVNKNKRTLGLFRDHLSFKQIEDCALTNGYLTAKSENYFDHTNSFHVDSTNEEKENFRKPYLIGGFEDDVMGNDMANFSEFMEKIMGEKFNNKKIDDSSNIYNEDVWNILDDIQKKFIGQESVSADLFYNIINNQRLVSKDNINDGERSIIFLDGPTGTGKTAITREITKRLDIPFTSTSLTNYSSVGYVGGDLTDTLKDLLKKADGDLEKAERGIIIFDEFDKIAYTRDGGLAMKKAVQQQLLDFMGGGKYKVSLGMGFFGFHEIEFDTSKLTFICLAALTDLRERKVSKEQLMGFGERVDTKIIDTYNITPDDLIKMGFERELIGRFNTYLYTNEYSKEGLLKILKESPISPMIGFKEWINSNSKKLTIQDSVYEIIANTAYNLNTGARSLQTVMNSIRTRFMKPVLRGNDDIVLNDDIVTNIIENAVSRKVRK